ncbi:tyrosine-type recombinase/integrase [Natrialba asiatica]|uniref:Integrase family protein n=1 Tax=Natrialba asiatica (strain ATCC 700177 / DSM 12278 / JCM 9576 / FERM P-10747 / NBRC 102637 / 172P1) TaxID=29540 RepID=M0B2D0_NATA1|nr:site-specific integrase [Natrialba asiatica]ELZ04940.1 integrase family protein [Natrialba asiatica DSM 12278]
MDSGNSRPTTDSRDRHPTDTTIQQSVDRYLNSLDSGGSRASMRPALNEFSSFCHEEGIDSVAELDSGDCREYGLRLRERTIDGDLAGSTANTYFRYVRAFLSFCVRDEQLDTNPADTERAEEFLPEDRPTRDTQFWTPEQRKQLLSYADERVRMAREETIDVPLKRAYRDRTIVVLLAELGVRGAELFRDRNDDDRHGLRWGDVDLDNRTLEVYGKSRAYEAVGLTDRAHNALSRLQRVHEPPTDDWPVFPTGHTASKYQAVEDATEERPEPGSDINLILREQAIAPPSITKEAGRQILKMLTSEAGIELEGDQEYLKPHGARRALGAELYEQGHSELAQAALRHKSIETTHEAYSDIQAADVAESIDEVRE